MKLYYYKEKNFGDVLNIWLWDKLIPGLIDNDERNVFIGIGTLINENLPKRTKNARWRVIFGAGVGYGNIPQLDDSYRIYCVRGPLSAQALGISSELAITDSAVLIRKLFDHHSKKVYKFSYMPHYELAGEAWSSVCKELGFGYIDPRWSIEKIFSCISQTEVLLTEAMHGAIVADALRVAWIPVITNPTILQFKWEDWCQSMKLEYKPAYLTRLHNPRQTKDILSPFRLTRDWIRQKKASFELLSLAKNAHPNLSSDMKIEQLTIEMYERLQIFKNDLESGIFSDK